MKKMTQILTAAIFCVFIAGFGLLHVLLPDRSFSPVENRNLSEFPEFSWSALADGSFTMKLEKYLADQFPLRDGWMGIKSRYEYLLGKREFHDVFLAGDTLIANLTDTSRAEKNLSYIQSLLEKTDKTVYLGLIPTAAEIWKDKLPYGAQTFSQLAYLEQAKELGANWVDMAGVLFEHREESIYYRTDHHWTSLGAYYGYTALLEAAGLDVPALGEGTTVADDFYGTLYSLSGVHWIAPDTIEHYVSGDGVTVEYSENGLSMESGSLYVESQLAEKDKYSHFLGGNNPLYVIQNPNAATDRTLLVVRDSYSDALAPFLSQTYREIHLIDLRYYKVSVAAYADAIGADDIFLCYSVENFVKDTDAMYIGQ